MPAFKVGDQVVLSHSPDIYKVVSVIPSATLGNSYEIYHPRVSPNLIMHERRLALAQPRFTNQNPPGVVTFGSPGFADFAAAAKAFQEPKALPRCSCPSRVIAFGPCQCGNAEREIAATTNRRKDAHGLWVPQ